MGTTTVSVVVPAFNAEKSIRQCISSAWNAGATEVIVVDDGSHDRTGRVAEAEGARVVTQENSGAAKARLLGISVSSGDSVVLLDADDQLVQAGLRKSVQMLTAEPDVAAVGGMVRGITKVGCSNFRAWPEGVTTRSLIDRGYGPIPPVGFVWRRAALLSALESDPRPLWPRYAEDYELLLRITLIGSVVLHDTHCADYSLVGGKSALTPMRSVQAAEAIRRHYSAALGIPYRVQSTRQLQATVKLRNAKSARASNKRLGTVVAVMQAALLDPKKIAVLAASRLGVR